jgi:hypothetical protein
VAEYSLPHKKPVSPSFQLNFLDAVQGDSYNVILIRKNDQEKAIALMQVKKSGGPHRLRKLDLRPRPIFHLPQI